MTATMRMLRALCLGAALIATNASCRKRGDATPITPPIEVLAFEVEPYERGEGDPPKREIYIAKPKYDAIIDGDKVLARAPTASLMIEYPLHKPAKFDIQPDGPGNAFTLRGLVRAIADCYARVYREEAATSTKPEGHVPGLENRAETNGKYGIWGHVLDDLVLERISIIRDPTGPRVLIHLSVGS